MINLFNLDLNNIMLNVGRREGKRRSCGEWGHNITLCFYLFIIILNKGLLHFEYYNNIGRRRTIRTTINIPYVARVNLSIFN